MVFSLINPFKKKSIFVPDIKGLNIEEFEQYVKTSTPSIIAQEYNTCFQDKEIAQCKAFYESNNKVKNRFEHVPCLDSSRVNLPGGKYIHANWVDSYQQKNAYICTQGPLPHTTEAFWIMVWNCEVKTIVMLTQTLTTMGARCHQYWTQLLGQDMIFGNLRINRINKTNLGGEMYCQSILRITQLSSQKYRDVTHFFYPGWPTLGIPYNLDHFVSLYNNVTHEVKEKGWPILVHCGDGAGQTGTFVTIDICIRRLRHQGLINVKRTVELLQSQRSGCIRSEQQYVFCHDILLTRSHEMMGLGVQERERISVGRKQQRRPSYLEDEEKGQDERDVRDEESLRHLRLKRDRELIMMKGERAMQRHRRDEARRRAKNRADLGIGFGAMKGNRMRGMEVVGDRRIRRGSGGRLSTIMETVAEVLDEENLREEGNSERGESCNMLKKRMLEARLHRRNLRHLHVIEEGELESKKSPRLSVRLDYTC